MEEVNIYNTSQDNSSSYTYDYEYYEQVEFIMKVVTIIIICIGLPLTLVAIYAVRSLVKDDHVVPIYVINLLITDLIQLCCFITWVLPEDWLLPWTDEILYIVYFHCLVASIGFMVCIALERYLVIACPLWYRFRRTIKVSVLVCVVVWALPAVIYCLLLTVRNDHVAPIFIINLLISDLIQLWYMIAKVAQLKDGMLADIFTHIYYFCGEVSDGFMWCIALKRMEEVNINNTSQDNNSSYTYDFNEQVEFIMKVVTIIIICIGLPLTLVAIYAVRSLVKDDHVVPIYVINLLITDLIQL
ncbi:hypothetical protein ABVT39_023183 [Epinephelus coioides]